ncbi:MAG: hypothetical protein Q9192_005820 [Flavoplaca navasiana]
MTHKNTRANRREDRRKKGWLEDKYGEYHEPGTKRFKTLQAELDAQKSSNTEASGQLAQHPSLVIPDPVFAGFASTDCHSPPNTPKDTNPAYKDAAVQCSAGFPDGSSTTQVTGESRHNDTAELRGKKSRNTEASGRTAEQAAPTIPVFPTFTPLNRYHLPAAPEDTNPADKDAAVQCWTEIPDGSSTAQVTGQSSYNDTKRSYDEQGNRIPKHDTINNVLANIAIADGNILPSKRMKFIPIELRDQLVTSEVVDSLKSYFSTQTLALLVAVTRIPAGWIVIVGDQPNRMPWTGVVHVASFSYLESRHWILLHADLAQKSLTCFDSLHHPSTTLGNLHKKACAVLQVQIASARHEFGGVDWTTNRARSIVQMDGSSCGPLAFRELERLIGIVTGAEETVASLRLRLTKSVLERLPEGISMTVPLPNELEEVEPGIEPIIDVPDSSMVEDHPLQNGVIVMDKETRADPSHFEDPSYVEDKKSSDRSDSSDTEEDDEVNPVRDAALKRVQTRRPWTTGETTLLLVLFGGNETLGREARDVFFPDRTLSSIHAKRRRETEIDSEAWNEAQRIRSQNTTGIINLIRRMAPHVTPYELEKHLTRPELTVENMDMGMGSAGGYGILVFSTRLSDTPPKGTAGQTRLSKLKNRAQSFCRGYLKSQPSFKPRVVKYFLRQGCSSVAPFSRTQRLTFIKMLKDRMTLQEPLVIYMSEMDSLTANLGSLQSVLDAGLLTNTTIEVLDRSGKLSVYSAATLGLLYSKVQKGFPVLGGANPSEVMEHLKYLQEIGRVALMKWEFYLPQSKFTRERQASRVRNQFSIDKTKQPIHALVCGRCGVSYRGPRMRKHMKEHDGVHVGYDDAVAFLEKISSVMSGLLTQSVH